MMKTLTLATAAVALTTAPVLAGSPEPAPIEPIIEAPAPAPVGVDWTGGYVGGQLGYAIVDGTGTAAAGDLDGDGDDDDGDDLIRIGSFNFGDDDGLIGGLTAGYDWDMGTWVAGVGADYDWTDGIDIGTGAELDSIWRLKARGGYKVGQGLIYGTAGYANADVDGLGDDDGYFVGAGYEHMLSQNFSMGGEVLYHQFDNFGSTIVDVEATTVQVRGTFRF